MLVVSALNVLEIGLESGLSGSLQVAGLLGRAPELERVGSVTSYNIARLVCNEIKARGLNLRILAKYRGNGGGGCMWSWCGECELHIFIVSAFRAYYDTEPCDNH